MTSCNDDELVKRLLSRTSCVVYGASWPRNPDGAEAADRISQLAEQLKELAEVRAERDALLEKPINLAKMDSIDEDATDRMIAYYWWQQAQEARSTLSKD